MAKVILSPNTARVLRAAQLKRDAPAEEIAKAARLPVYTVRYELTRLLREEIIRPGVVVDPYRIGLLQFQCYCSLSFRTELSRSKLFDYLRRSPSVAWFADLAGRFQVGMSICAANTGDLLKFFTQLTETSRCIIGQRQIGLVSSFTLYPRRYFDPSNKRNDRLEISAETAATPLTEDQRRALNMLLANPGDSTQQLASKLRVPRTTLANRLNALESSGVVLSKIFFVKSARFNIETSKVLLYLAQHDDASHQRVLKLLQQELNIVNAVRCVGAWDYEFTVEHDGPQPLRQFIHAISETLGATVRDIEVCQVFEQGQAHNFLQYEQRGGASASR